MRRKRLDHVKFIKLYMPYKDMDVKSMPPTGTAYWDRLPLFATPVQGGVHWKATLSKSVAFRTPYGDVQFKRGFLDQIHRDILHVLLTDYHVFNFFMGAQQQWASPMEAPIRFVIQPRLLLKKIGSKSANTQWLWGKLHEMRDAFWSLSPKFNGDLKAHFMVPPGECTCGYKEKTSRIYYEHGRVFCSIFSEVRLVEREEVVELNYPPTAWVLVLNDFFAKMFLHDTAVHAQSLTVALVRERYGFVKALVRFCINQEFVKRSLKEVLVCIGLIRDETPRYTISHYHTLLLSADMRQHLERTYHIYLMQPYPDRPREWWVQFYRVSLHGRCWVDNHLVDLMRRRFLRGERPPKIQRHALRAVGN